MMKFLFRVIQFLRVRIWPDSVRTGFQGGQGTLPPPGEKRPEAPPAPPMKRDFVEGKRFIVNKGETYEFSFTSHDKPTEVQCYYRIVELDSDETSRMDLDEMGGG